MALARTARGTATSTTSGTNNLTRVPTGNFAANSLAVLCVAYDNSGTGGADPFGTGSVTDTAGNTWTPRHNTLRDPSTASAGTVLRIFTSAMDVAALTTSHTITFTTQSNVTAKVCSLHEITAASGYKATYLSTGTGAVGASTTPSVTTGTIQVGDMVIGAVANEYGTAQTLNTPDGDTTNGTWDTNTYIEIGTTTSGQNLTVQAKVQTTTASTQTYNLTFATSTDWAAGWISVDEVLDVTTVSGSFTASAVIGATETGTFSADAVIAAPQSSSFSLDAVILRTHTNGLSYRDTILADSPLRYYRLGEADGTTVTDATGNYDGDYYNSPTLGAAALITGDSDTAVTFASASNQYVNMANTDLPTGSAQRTTEAWVKSTTASTMAILAYGAAATGQAWWVRLASDGRLAFSLYNTDLTFGTAGDLNDGDPHHVVVLYDGTYVRAYIDGTEATGSPSAQTPATGVGTTWIANDGSSRFNGTIDEVAFYDTALTAQQVVDHYTAGITGGGITLDAYILGGYTGSFSLDAVISRTWGGPAYRQSVLADSPIAYWRLGEPSGATADNAEGTAAYDGEYTGTPTLGVGGLLAGDPDTAVSFDAAVPEWVLVEDMPAGSSAGASIEGWVSLDVLPVAGNVAIGCWGVGWSGDGYHLLLIGETGGNRWVTWGFRDQDSQEAAYSDYYTFATGTTYHIAASHDYVAQTVSFYVNGSHVSTEDVSGVSAAKIPVAGDTFNIATYNYGASYNLDGIIDEVAVYDYPLASQQIIAHYATGTGTSASFSLNAFIVATISGSFTASAIIAKPQTGSFSLDAVIKREQSGSFSADAVIAAPQAGSFAADAVIRKTILGGAPAGFPSATESGANNEAADPQTANLPTYATGDMLVVIAHVSGLGRTFGNWTFDGSTTAFTQVFTNGGAHGTTAAKYRVMQAGDSGTSLSLDVSTSSSLQYSVLRFPAGDFDPATAPYGVVGTQSFGGTGDPPAITAPWGSDNNTFFAIANFGNEVELLDIPDNYTLYTPRYYGDTLVVAYRELAAATDDPTIFDWEGSTSYYATFSMVVRPSDLAPTTADAVIAATQTGSFSLDAVIQKTMVRVPLAVYNFESGGIADWDYNTGPPTVESGVVHSGLYALHCNPTGTSEGVWEAFGGGSAYGAVVSAYFRFESLPVASTQFWEFLASGSNPSLAFDSTTGKLKVGIGEATQLGTTVVEADRWYRFDARYSSLGTDHYIDWAIDGEDQGRYTQSRAEQSISGPMVGNVDYTGTYDAYFDDVLFGRELENFPLYPTTTFTFDAEISAGMVTVPGDFPADAVIRREQTGSFSGDAVVRRTESYAVTADAILLREGHAASLTTDAIVRRGQTGSWTADAIVRKSSESAATLDAVVQESRSGFFSVNAVVRSSASSSALADAVIRATAVSAASSAAIISSTAASTFSSDAIVRKTSSLAFVIDALVRKSFTSAFSLDAIVRRTQDGSFAADAWIEREQSGSFTANAALFKLLVFTADAITNVERLGSFTEDAWILGTNVYGIGSYAVIWREQAGQLTADAVARVATTGTVTLDAVFRASAAGSLTTDAIIARAGAGSLTGDAAVRATASAAFVADAVIRRPETGTLTTDAIIRGQTVGTSSADAVILRERTGALVADAWVQGSGVAAFAADAVITRTGSGAFTANAVSRATLVGDFTASAISMRTVAETFVSDAVLASTEAGSLTGDAVVRRAASESITADAVIRQLRVGSLTTDAIVLLTESIAASADAIFFAEIGGSITAQAWLSGTFTADAIVEKENTGSLTADAVVMPVFSMDATLRRSQEGQFTGEAWIPGTNVYAFSLNSTLRAVIGQEFTADSVTRAEGSGTITASSAISAGTGQAFTADAVAQKSSSGDLTADAVVVAGRTVGFGADAVLLFPEIGSAIADAVLLVSQSGSTTADAALRASYVNEFTAHTLILAPRSGSATADAYLFSANARAFTADAVILGEQLAQFLGEALVQQVIQGDLRADATILASHNDSFRADSALQATLERTFKSDAVTLNSLSNSVNSFAVIQRNIQEGISADAEIRGRNAFTADAVISGGTEFLFSGRAIIVLPTGFIEAALDLEILEASLSVDTAADVAEAVLQLDVIEAALNIGCIEALITSDFIEATISSLAWWHRQGSFSASAVLEV